MKRDLHERTKAWVDAWERAAPTLKSLRIQEMKEQDAHLPQVLASFNEVFEMAVRENPPPLSSGLVEQQLLFQRLRKAED